MKIKITKSELINLNPSKFNSLLQLGLDNVMLFAVDRAYEIAKTMNKTIKDVTVTESPAEDKDGFIEINIEWL